MNLNELNKAIEKETNMEKVGALWDQKVRLLIKMKEDEERV